MNFVDGTGDVPGDRLESWKEIASFLGRGITTVQRWEEEEGLPIHRHAHARRGTVYAYRSELADWRNSRKSSAPTPEALPVTIPGRIRPMLVAGVVLASALCLGLILHRLATSSNRD